MASLDRHVTQKWVRGYQYYGKDECTMMGYHDTKMISCLRLGCQNGEVVDVESLPKLSGGVVDDEPFLISRNTLGNGKTANSKSPKANLKWW